MTNRLAVVIPAYRPSAGLIDVVRQLSAKGRPIVVVDDGSGPDFRDTFAAVAAFPDVQLLRHAVNLGKGARPQDGVQPRAVHDARRGRGSHGRRGRAAPPGRHRAGGRTSGGTARRAGARSAGLRWSGAAAEQGREHRDPAADAGAARAEDHGHADRPARHPRGAAAPSPPRGSHRLRVRTGDAADGAPALDPHRRADDPDDLRAGQSELALQPVDRLDEDLLRPAALRVGLNDVGAARQPGLHSDRTPARECARGAGAGADFFGRVQLWAGAPLGVLLEAAAQQGAPEVHRAHGFQRDVLVPGDSDVVAALRDGGRLREAAGGDVPVLRQLRGAAGADLQAKRRDRASLERGLRFILTRWRSAASFWRWLARPCMASGRSTCSGRTSGTPKGCGASRSIWSTTRSSRWF